MDLHGEARHRNPDERDRFEVAEFFDVAVADVAAGAVALPDDAGVAGLGVPLGCVANGASQLQASVPVTRTPWRSRCSVASWPMPQPVST